MRRSSGRKLTLIVKPHGGKKMSSKASRRFGARKSRKVRY